MRLKTWCRVYHAAWLKGRLFPLRLIMKRLRQNMLNAVKIVRENINLKQAPFRGDIAAEDGKQLIMGSVGFVDRSVVDIVH